MDAITLGPAFIPLERLLFVIAMGVTLGLGYLLERRYDLLGAPGLWVAMLTGFAVGRIVHVVVYWPLFERNPIEVLYVWQGGFHLPAGLVAALAMGVVWSQWRKQPPSMSLAPMLAGALVWVGGSLLVLSDSSEGELPELWLSDLDGSEVQLTELTGQPMVVNLWATWCPPCVREMPTFQRAEADWPDVTFVYANQGENAPIVNAFIERENLELNRVVLDPPSLLAQHFEARGYPTTLFFDAHGQLVAAHPGEVSAVRLQQYLEAF